MCFCFLFKQKTAYEMRSSDWSSDVCSSDLLPRLRELADDPLGALRCGVVSLEVMPLSSPSLSSPKLHRSSSRVCCAAGLSAASLPLGCCASSSDRKSVV